MRCRVPIYRGHDQQLRIFVIELWISIIASLIILIAMDIHNAIMDIRYVSRIICIIESWISITYFAWIMNIHNYEYTVIDIISIIHKRNMVIYDKLWMSIIVSMAKVYSLLSFHNMPFSYPVCDRPYTCSLSRNKCGIFFWTKHTRIL